ncbi:MAG: hypothetical protein JWP09_875 [Candidatus Taylorbacteria bacterium]|nr:hypothetical protein [Candidatus Taylorbacteria bacterium]
MNKITKTIAGIVAVVAFVAVAATGASASTFTRSLTVGSKGADVTALQTWLNQKGYLAVAPTGYFGNLTKAAVAAFQAANGVTPAVGYFGPLTQAKWEMVAAGSTGSTSSVSGCVAGAMFSSTTGASCATGTVSTGTPSTMDGQDGSVTLSYSPYVTSSQTIKKGETKDVYAVKLKATSGNVAVNRFDIHFSERPWLDFSKLTLRDSNGNVIATKTLSSAADATEVTVGSDYLVRFDNVNYSVTPANDPILVVSATVVASSDKITGQTVTISLPSGSIRTVNGKGYTDSLGGLQSNTVVLSQSGSTADLYTRISPNTPDRRIVTTSVNTTTNDVVLGTFSLKSQNQNSTLNSLNFSIAKSSNVSLFQNVRLVDGTNTYGANAVTASTTATADTVTFSNLTIGLTQDAWKDVKVIADVLQNVNGVSASTTLVKSSIVGVDANYNTVTTSNATNATANDVQLQIAGISVGAMSASYSLTTGGANGNTTGAAVTFTFTATNTGNSDVYISKVPGVALATSTVGSVGNPATASSTITYVSANPSTFAADTGSAPTSGAYVIPAGSSRTLTYSGSLDNTNGTAGIRVFKVTSINFGTSAATPTGSAISFNLDPLTVTPSLSAN